ncbi:MAG TPA: hypothetical protein PKC77_15215, partial [Sphingopyxis sp.]|nr:hypothetical protein [Sphingopyxis sp.]
AARIIRKLGAWRGFLGKAFLRCGEFGSRCTSRRIADYLLGIRKLVIASEAKQSRVGINRSGLLPPAFAGVAMTKKEDFLRMRKE